MDNTISGLDFDIIVSEYLRVSKRKNETEGELAELRHITCRVSYAFMQLAERIYDAFRINSLDRDDAIQEGVMICFEKINRYNPQKGRAFNFFTTVILSIYRQTYRPAKNYNELKSRYKEFLNG